VVGKSQALKAGTLPVYFLDASAHHFTSVNIDFPICIRVLLSIGVLSAWLPINKEAEGRF
jgi:hypothetical protein